MKNFKMSLCRVSIILLMNSASPVSFAAIKCQNLPQFADDCKGLGRLQQEYCPSNALACRLPGSYSRNLTIFKEDYEHLIEQGKRIYNCMVIRSALVRIFDLNKVENPTRSGHVEARNIQRNAVRNCIEKIKEMKAFGEKNRVGFDSETKEDENSVLQIDEDIHPHIQDLPGFEKEMPRLDVWER